ncbi:MAG: serine/threonine protein kinase [Lachnospiraceae bacterium]|nr:serine/threonine protein kinase [Lachnospiraceae bacterium]
MAEIGQIIGEKYEILTQIGKGGMSTVYLARDQRLNKQWAIKEVKKDARDENDEEVSQSAIAEANMIKDLDNNNIVRITDIIETEDVIYIVEDFVEGRTLAEILVKEGPQPQERVIGWAIQLCKALEYLHTREKPIIYRDMKPANVMLQTEGSSWEDDKIKIIDFGIARTYKEENNEDTKLLGTRGYAAPEQFGGLGQTDARTDIYCLGKTLYCLLTGQAPYDNMDPIRVWNPSLDSGLEYIIDKCIKSKPEERFQSCAELIYALEHYQEYGEEYRKAQADKLKKFSIVAILSIVFIIVGGVLLIVRSKITNDDYDINIVQAEKAATPEERISYYEKAIEVKPGETKPYIGMIEAMKDDASFTTKESDILTSVVTTNNEVLKDQEDYAELAFEIGKIYWYYYDYGKSDGHDNQITRMKSSIQWFTDAVDYGSESDDFYQMARVYMKIGEFNRDITMNVQEASDKGEYAEYWDSVKELIEYIDSQEETNEFVQLEIYKLAYSTIETYGKKLKADKVQEDDVREIYTKVTYDIQNMSTTSDTTEEVKVNLISRKEAVEAAITNAYREQVIANE